MTTNDNDAIGDPGPNPDQHGYAALLLVESLIHVLLARGIIAPADATEAVDVTADANGELAACGPEAAQIAMSHKLLRRIGATMRIDQRAAQGERGQG